MSDIIIYKADGTVKSSDTPVEAASLARTEQTLGIIQAILEELLLLYKLTH